MAEALKPAIEPVQIALRIRPLIQHELNGNQRECLNVETGEPQVTIKNLTFAYDYVFPSNITQKEFYDRSISERSNRILI